MNSNLRQLRPMTNSKVCVWCRQDFDSVPDLLDHVVDFHIDDEEFAA